MDHLRLQRDLTEQKIPTAALTMLDLVGSVRPAAGLLALEGPCAGSQHGAVMLLAGILRFGRAR